MTMRALPPTLTWMHLLPAGAGMDCHRCRSWFVEQVRRHARDGDECVVMGEGGTSGAKRAAEAGFEYVRRFAVLPRMGNPRWFIPLDNRRVAAGAFGLYTPTRRLAHWKKLAARAAARLGAAAWCCDEIIIAARSIPPLERRLAEVFGTGEIRLGLSAGAPEPAINRKASAVVLSLRGEVLGFVKLAESPVARRIARHEAQALAALGQFDALRGLAPKLLLAAEVDGRIVTVQTPLAARHVPAARWSSAHERFLAALRVGPVKNAAQMRMVRTLAERVAALSDCGIDLAGALEEIMPVLRSMQVAATIVHGDFAPWNLRSAGGRVCAFDWEYAELDGLPMIDQTHFVLQLAYQMRGVAPEAAQGELEELAQRRPLGLEVQQARALQLVYLIDQLARLLGEGYPPIDHMVAWYASLLGRLCPRRREAVAA